MHANRPILIGERGRLIGEKGLLIGEKGLLIGGALAAVRVAGCIHATFAERGRAHAVAGWWPQPWARLQVHSSLALLVQWYKY